MKKLTYILLTLLVLSACTGTSRHPQLVAADSLMLSRPDSALTFLRGMSFTDKADRMYHYLLLADACNKCYDTLPSDSILQEVADYYDRHGTANEQVRAHYLLGCAYRDEGNAPLALNIYNSAIEKADTNDSHCDFRTISMVYGQMALLFHLQRAPRLEIEARKNAIDYSWKAKDTLSAITFHEYLSGAYHMLNMLDSALYYNHKAAQMYKDINRYDLASGTLGLDIDIYLRKKDYENTKRALDEYEQKSLNFKKGEIRKGMEVFYTYKGEYYEKTGNLDSAMLLYQKALFSNPNMDVKEAAYKGFLSLYQKLNNGDSIAKYSELYCQTNDSSSFTHSADEITRMQAIYNYTRHREVARQKTIEANRSRQAIMVGSFVGLLVITLLLFALYRNRRKKQEEITLLQRQYEHDVDKLEQARYDMVRMQEEQLTRLIEEKEADIRELQRQVDAYGQQARPEDRLEGFLSETASYRRFRHFIMHPQEKATLDDWKLLHDMIDRKLPAFRTTLYSAQPGLKASDYDVCVLDRLYFTPSEIAMLTGKSLSSITMKRVRLLGKLFHVTGKGSQFDAFIRKIS